MSSVNVFYSLNIIKWLLLISQNHVKQSLHSFQPDKCNHNKYEIGVVRASSKVTSSKGEVITLTLGSEKNQERWIKSKKRVALSNILPKNTMKNQGVCWEQQIKMLKRISLGFF